MFKSLDELVKALEAHEQVKSIMPDIQSFFTDHTKSLEEKIDVEKKKGIAEKNKVNKEAEGLRKYKTTFIDTFGFNPDEDDLETFAKDLSDVLKSVKDGGDPDKVKLSPEFKEMQKQLNKLTKEFSKTKEELAAERNNAAELRKKSHNGIIRSKLVDAFKSENGESKIYATDIVVDNMISSGMVKLDDDEKTVVFVDGESSIDLEDGVKGFLEKRKDLIRNNQSGGSGSGGNNNQGGAGGETLEQRKARIQKLANPSSL